MGIGEEGGCLKWRGAWVCNVLIAEPYIFIFIRSFLIHHATGRVSAHFIARAVTDRLRTHMTTILSDSSDIYKPSHPSSMLSCTPFLTSQFYNSLQIEKAVNNVPPQPLL